ncbi:hypothetical protein HCN44_003957 [Aphidius gifuensis]|uniref:Uncharacterized protein n=1 Tax=Aphidius gifuensis TaxID=684658 RepID=A0A834XW16_APHGI|nr:hypothetical protein HCN44_003957 [Aphidius gifuensis]
MPNQLNRSNNQNVDCQNDESSKELIDKVVPEIKPKDRISWRIRVIITQLGIIMLFLVSTIFVKINTDEWQHLFLKITLITAAGLNALGSILAGTIFGVVGHFPPKYISSCSQGLSSSGILSTILQILSLWLSTGPIATGFIVVDSKEQEVSSSMLTAFLGVGCIAGAIMSFFYLTLL